MPARFKDLDHFTKQWLKPEATAKQLAEALEHEHPLVRSAALEHPNTPHEVVQRLIDAGSTSDLKGLSGSANPLSAIDWRKLKSGGPWARLLAVVHPSWNADAFWKEDDLVVKRLLALQLKTPETYLKLLLCDESDAVRFLVSQHPGMSGLKYQYELAGTTPTLRINDRPQAGVGQAFLIGLAEGNRWQRRLAARHFLTPLSHLEALKKDASHMVRCAVTYNPTTPAEVLDHLASDLWGPVRVGVAKNPRSYADTLELLSHDHDDDVRLAVTQNMFTPGSILVDILNSGEISLQIAAASNPRTPYESRLSASQDPAFDLRIREVAKACLSLSAPEAPINHRYPPTVIVVPEHGIEVLETIEKKSESAASLVPLDEFAKMLCGTTLKAVELDELRTKEVVQTNVRDHIDQIAVAAVMELERHLGHQPLEMSHDNVGYDISTELENGQQLYLEVKGKGPETEVLQVSRSQINFSQLQNERFILAVVTTDTTEARSVYYVPQPFRDLVLPLPKSVLSVTFNLAQIVSLGQEVWTRSS